MVTDSKSKMPEPLIKPNIKQRTCLRCRLSFSSLGSWNRICPKCTEEVEDKRYSKLEASDHGIIRRKGGHEHGH